MLKKLLQKGYYKNVICSPVGGGHKVEEIADNSYDAVIISGGFVQAHLPIDCLKEVARVLKPGMKNT